jgi:hypothetical protein
MPRCQERVDHSLDLSAPAACSIAPASTAERCTTAQATYLGAFFVHVGANYLSVESRKVQQNFRYSALVAIEMAPAIRRA